MRLRGRGDHRIRTVVTCENLEARLLLDADPWGGWMNPNPWGDPFADLGPAFDPGKGDLEFPGFPGIGTYYVVSTQPADGATLSRLPETLRVTFDSPLDPFLLGNDIQIFRVEPDAGLTPAGGPFAQVTSAIDPDHPETLLITFHEALGPGTYQLVLLRGSFLLAPDVEAGLSPKDPGQNLARFEIAQELDLEANDLGTLGTDPIAILGKIETFSPTDQVALYRFTLTANQPLWAVGIEVSAQREGSPLNPALALFDSFGNLIATADFGRADALDDPFLFHGLRPGTYFIGVSASPNLPGQPGGYDLKSQTPGQAGADQPGGTFTLHVLASEAGGATAVTGFAIDRADPLDPAPTGFRIQFSGSVQLSGSRTTDTSNGGLELIDALGQIWPLTMFGLDETTATMSLGFNDRLPAGLYRVRLTENSPLTDLVGRHPMTSGLPKDTLAVFRIQSSNTERAPDDLGALYPSQWSEGLPLEVAVEAGQRRTLRLVLPADGLVVARLGLSGGGASVHLVQPHTGARIPLSIGTDGSLRTTLVDLTAGELFIEIEAGADTPALARLKLDFQLNLHATMQNGGLGQGPALRLLIAPRPGLGLADATTGLSRGTTASPRGSTPLGPDPATGGSTRSDSGHNAAAPVSPETLASRDDAPLPAPLYLTMGGLPLGASTSTLTTSAQVSASTAFSSRSLGPGPGEGEGHRTSGLLNMAARGRVQPGEGASSDGALPALDPSALAAGFDDIPTQNVELAQAFSGLFDRLGTVVAEMAALPAALGVDNLAPSLTPALLPGADPQGEESPTSIQQDMNGPVALGLMAVAMIHYRDRLARSARTLRDRTRRGSARATDPGQDPLAV